MFEKELNEYWKTVVNTIQDGVMIADTNGTIISANRALEKDNQIEAFRRELRSQNGFHGLLGTSAPMQLVFGLITNAARSGAPLIIFGESGIGKQLATGIDQICTHQACPRGNGRTF